MTDASPTLPPADWYIDPQNAWQQRWWTGTTWSEHTRPIPMPEPPPFNPVWQPVQSPETVKPQSNFGDPYEPPPRPPRRGFLDSPFERPGTPRNRAGTYSLVFALFHFTLVPVVMLVLMATTGIVSGLFSGVFLGVALAITAVTLGITGIARARRIGGRRGTAIAGLIVGLFALLSSLGGIVAVANVSLARSMVYANIERRAAASILDQYGETVTLDCPKNLTADAGTSYLCAGTDSRGAGFNLKVTFTDSRGTFTWELEPSGLNP